jgi:hypothetical protein
VRIEETLIENYEAVPDFYTPPPEFHSTPEGLEKP